ncbi:MAG: bifunctional folylpolyglutamate synthase/dihydrofolate synthase [Anaerolinea sp.]|nr:bifunctional folylpolyglutamate synthase/dihydrofolate synthase [Anaerolinea sp.]
MTLPPDYQAALDYIFNYVDYERRRSVLYTEAAWDLARTRRVLHTLGDPHLGLRIVHVAGSKGKGSTAANIDSVLRAAGLRTGFYSSPHLHTFRERIRVDGQLIAPQDVVRLLAQCQPAIEAVPGITTFEIMTVLALLHFAQQQVDWVVLEVGLGGRLDATNVVTPAVSVITPISFEHTALLGDTLAKIAREKAGIIKPGVPVVVAPQEAEALAVFQEVAAAQGARLVQVGRDWRWQALSDGLDGQTFAVHSAACPWPLDELRELRTPLLGAHQLANATTAIAACAELASQGAPIDADSLRRGLSQVVWPCRLEVLAAPAAQLPEQDQVSGMGATVVLDSAHNDASARLLRSALGHYFAGRPLLFILGVSNDKDAAGILAELLPGAAAAVLTRSRHPRAADPRELAPLAERYLPGDRVSVVDSVADALAQSLAQTSPETVICLTGSLFIAGEAREAWLARHPGYFPAGDWVYAAEPPAPDWQVTQRPAGN